MKKKMVKLMLAAMAIVGVSFATLGNEVLAEEVVTEETDVTTAFNEPGYNDSDPNRRYEMSEGTWDPNSQTLTLHNGALATNGFFCDGTYTYYLQCNGKPMKGRLSYHPDGVHVIYFDEYGHEVFNNFVNVKFDMCGQPVDDLMFFNVYGFSYQDQMTYDQAGVNLYYVNRYGVVERNGWFKYSDAQGGDVGYANPDGSLVTNKVMVDGCRNYVYLQGNGHGTYQIPEGMPLPEKPNVLPNGMTVEDALKEYERIYGHR